MENILIDTDVVIEYLRTRDKAQTLLIKLFEKYDPYLTPITEFELFLGAKTPRHRNDLEMLFNEVEMMPFEFGCGEIAADIWNELKGKHQHPEIRDIFIAAIAIRNKVPLCTFNKKHFTQIDGVKFMDDPD